MERSGPPEGRSEAEGVRVLVNVTGSELLPPEVPHEEALRDFLEAGVRATLAHGGVRDGEVSLTLVDDARIRELNRQYLDRDRPTDVIAFPLYEAEEPLVGDVYVGAERARVQAAERGIPWVEELLRLAIHGTLHVLGHEHPEGEGVEGEGQREEGGQGEATGEPSAKEERPEGNVGANGRVGGDPEKDLQRAREESEMFRLQEALLQRVLAERRPPDGAARPREGTS